MKKIILSLFLCLLLVACTSSKYEEKGTVDATVRIAYNTDDKVIKVSNVIIKCNDAYYGVTVNDSINFNNKNNYFTTSSGLKVMITSDKLKTGSLSTNDTFTASTMIEDGVYLYASGDEEKVKEVFDNVFKTNREVYTFLNHDINPEWMKEVNITDDVISFSNGVNTIYAYQNDGSLSDGCIKGRIEPTVFMKALRGIDLPITYPENTQDRIDYIPYGLEEYEHYTNEGYTPYSVYAPQELTTVTEKVVNIELKKEVNSAEKEMTNYILLANNDEDVLDLFNDRNNHNQTLYSLSVSSGNTDVLDINSNINLSDKKNIAKDVINSDNRYHFGISTSKDEDGHFYTTPYNSKWNRVNADGYYVDTKIAYADSLKNFTIANNMVGKVVIPTIKYSIPSYYGKSEADNSVPMAINSFNSLKEKGYCFNEINGCNFPFDYYYASDLKVFSLHGENDTFDFFLNSPPSTSRGIFNYIQSGDYAYRLNSNGTFDIFRFTNTSQLYDKDNGFDKGLNTMIEFDTNENPEMFNYDIDGYLNTCQETGYNAFTAYSNIHGNYQYDMRGTK